MNYPSSLNVFGHHVDVKIFSDPIEVVEAGGNTDVVLAQYDPQTTTISLMHVPDKPAIGMSNCLHEIIECIDVHADLKLNHTQISTLASGLYQALASGGFNFSDNPIQ
jgi:hypothetical protein